MSDDWDWEAAEHRVPADGAGARLCVSFDNEEAEAVMRRAQFEGKLTTQYVKDLALRDVATPAFKVTNYKERR